MRPSTGTPVAIIEAKAISQEETRLWTADEDPGEIQEWEQERLDQLEGYVNDLQLATGYAVLTDGASWDIYDLSRTGAFSGKRLHYFDTGPQAQNRMALGVKGGGMWGQWYTLSPPPPVGAMPKPRLTRSEGPPTPSPG